VGNGDRRTATYDCLKHLIFDDPTLQTGLDDFGTLGDSYLSDETLYRGDKGNICPLSKGNPYGGNYRKCSRRCGCPDKQGWSDLRPDEVCWTYRKGRRAGKEEIAPYHQTSISDWPRVAAPGAVGRTDTVNISPRVYPIRLEPNKTFAGRTENGHIGCKHCKSSRIVKNGKRGDKQLYLCKACGKQFIDNGCFPRMRTSARAISTALEAYFDGLSLSKIVGLLRRAFGITISRVSVWGWIQKYVPLVKALLDRIRVNAVGTWHVDETMVRVKGKNHWFWDGIDHDTRFIIMGLLTRTRTISAAKEFFNGARSQVGNRAPAIIVTDGCGAYRKGVSKNFWGKVQLGECKLIQKQGLRARIGKLSNNLIERFHNTLKDRTKIVRGFGSKKGAFNALSGFVIQYNYLRPHMALHGETPAVTAGIRLPFENGWGDLIQWALS